MKVEIITRKMAERVIEEKIRKEFSTLYLEIEQLRLKVMNLEEEMKIRWRQ